MTGQKRRNENMREKDRICFDTQKTLCCIRRKSSIAWCMVDTLNASLLQQIEGSPLGRNASQHNDVLVTTMETFEKLMRFEIYAVVYLLMPLFSHASAFSYTYIRPPTGLICVFFYLLRYNLVVCLLSSANIWRGKKGAQGRIQTFCIMSDHILFDFSTLKKGLEMCRGRFESLKLLDERESKQKQHS